MVINLVAPDAVVGIDALQYVVYHFHFHLIIGGFGHHAENEENAEYGSQDDEFAQATVVESLGCCLLFFVTAIICLIHNV
jgi:hypothetical protein